MVKQDTLSKDDRVSEALVEMVVKTLLQILFSEGFLDDFDEAGEVLTN